MEGVLSSVGGEDGDNVKETSFPPFEPVLYPPSSSSLKNGFFGEDRYVLIVGFKLELNENGFSFLIFSSTSTLIKGSNGSNGVSI